MQPAQFHGRGLCIYRYSHKKYTEQKAEDKQPDLFPIHIVLLIKRKRIAAYVCNHSNAAIPFLMYYEIFMIPVLDYVLEIFFPILVIHADHIPVFHCF